MLTAQRQDCNYYPIKRPVYGNLCVDLHRLDANSFFGMIGKACGQRDAVVAGGLQPAPVVAGNDLYRNNGIGAGAVDGGIGDEIAFFHILDCTDYILGTPVMPAAPYIPIPG